MTPNNQDLGHVLGELQHKIQEATEHLRTTKESRDKAIAEKARLVELMKTKEMEIEKARAEISSSKQKISQVEREEAKLTAELRKLEVE
ncbi:hypothetical protein EB052_02105, partial [bacterium]|nr:hypothetical protein [bacterium]